MQRCNLKKVFLYLCVLTISFFQGGCSIIEDGVDQTKHVSIIDANGGQLTDVLVIPLYCKSYGIGAGPDGKGFKSSRYVVTRSFIFYSGDDLMKKSQHSKSIVMMFPPYIFMGRGNHVLTWVFIKKGYFPKLVKNKEIKVGAPIVMIKSKVDESSILVDMLFSPKPDQNILRKQFGVDSVGDDIAVILDKKDFDTLTDRR